MKKLLVFTLIAVCEQFFSTSTCAAIEITPLNTSDARRVRNGEWELIITFRAIGTRSEGQHGELFQNGSQIIGKEGQILQTPLGELRHYGSRTIKKHLWEPTGWNFSSSEKFIASGQ